ncbi:hypothetical protein EVA_08674 [gut metagenome]|uniref:Uncharacterized protein n=1 Tax=gut metagenome TaxID=749906 RepID=J9G7K0_9ZZZZ
MWVSLAANAGILCLDRSMGAMLLPFNLPAATHFVPSNSMVA